MVTPNLNIDSLGLLMGTLSMSDIGGSILNIFNDNLSTNLDNYNKSTPNFYVSGSNQKNILRQNIQLTKADFERSSILLPDLSMARAGDVLVRYKEDGKVHVAIIVSADFTNLDSSSTAEDYMEKIIVVSITSGFKMANIGKWINNGNTSSGFVSSDVAKEYHLRRLVKLTGDADKTYVQDDFELLDKTLISLDVDLDPVIDDYPWVPNTGELYKFDNIYIHGDYFGEVEELIDKDKEITILPPLDMYHFDYENSDDATDKYEDDSNIYQNKGDGLNFYAVDGKNAILLATFELKSESEIKALDEGESPYSVKYNRDIFVSETDPTPKYDYELYVDRDKLSFKAKNYETTNNGIRSKNTKIFTQFAVRPLNNNTAEPAKGNIRPGDDFLLRFGVLCNEAVTGVVEDEDFIAVYDKKMLWRANLYINENNDWNEKYPWNAPSGSLNNANNTGIVTTEDHYNEFGFVNAVGSSDTSELKWYGVNEWNHDMGGQIEIYKWTRFSDNETVDGSVAYGWGCRDDVKSFNDELLAQRDAIRDYYSSENEKWQTETNPHPEWNDWEFTTAPNEDWANYIKPRYITSIDTYNSINFFLL